MYTLIVLFLGVVGIVAAVTRNTVKEKRNKELIEKEKALKNISRALFQVSERKKTCEELFEKHSSKIRSKKKEVKEKKVKTKKYRATRRERVVSFIKRKIELKNHFREIGESNRRAKVYEEGLALMRKQRANGNIIKSDMCPICKRKGRLDGEGLYFTCLNEGCVAYGRLQDYKWNRNAQH